MEAILATKHVARLQMTFFFANNPWFYSAWSQWPDSLTRFGEVWPLCQNILRLWQFCMVFLVFGKILNLLWKKFHAIGQIFIVVNGQILKSYLAIWSFWHWPPRLFFFIFIKQFSVYNVQYRLQMTGSEPGFFGIGSDRAVNCATITTSMILVLFTKYPIKFVYSGTIWWLSEQWVLPQGVSVAFPVSLNILMKSNRSARTHWTPTY